MTDDLQMVTPGMTVVEALEEALRDDNPDYIDIHEDLQTEGGDEYHDLAWGAMRRFLAKPQLPEAIERARIATDRCASGGNYRLEWAECFLAELLRGIPIPHWQEPPHPPTTLREKLSL